VHTLYSTSFQQKPVGNATLETENVDTFMLWFNVFSIQKLRPTIVTSGKLTRAVLVAGFSDTYCILGLVPSESEIRSLYSLSTNGGVLSREASLELLQDGSAVAVSSITVMAGTMGDSKANTLRSVTVLSSYS
jgi:hypothetical protein